MTSTTGDLVTKIVVEHTTEEQTDKLSISPFKIYVTSVGGGRGGWRWKLECGNRGISSGSANTKIEARQDGLRALISLSEYWKRVAESELRSRL